MTSPSEASRKPGLIVRTRLLERLEPGRCRRIRLLHAPAGFGKSELARQLAEQARQPLLWLDLHSSPGGLEQFCSQLAGALGLDAEASFGQVEEALQRHVNAFVVLDGYSNEATTDKWLERLFEASPPGLQWLVCARCRPAWRIGRWLLADELLILDGDDLAFTVGETEMLLSRLNMARSISAEDLQRQSEGWIAGIRLHLLSLQSVGHHASGLLHRNALIQDYLDSEVMEYLSAEMLDLLRVIAHAPFVDGPLCTFLADDPLALNRLLEQQVFMHRLPGSEDRFTLFAPLKRILQERYPDQAAPLLAASSWLHLAGAHVEAFRYALAIPDTSRALVSIGRTAPRELYIGQKLNYLLEGIDQLGPDWLKQHPEALEIIARSLLMGGRLDEAEATIELIAERDSDLRMALSAELSLHQGQAQKARSLGFQALDGLARNGLWAQMILCFSCLTRASLALGDIATARHLQHQGIELSRRKGEVLFECLLMLDQAQIDELAGNLPQALLVLDQIDLLLAQNPSSALLKGCKSIRRGWLLILTGQEHQARQTLEDGMLLVQACRSPVSVYGHVLLAQLDANNGDFASAQQRLVNVQRQMHAWNVAEVIYRGVLSMSTARVWLRSNHSSSASQLLSRLREQYEGTQALTSPSSFPELHALLGFLQAEVLCSRGSLGDAGLLLDAVLEWAEGNTFEVLVCQARYALAEVRRMKGDVLQSERLFASAAAMAVHQGQRNLLTGIQSGVVEPTSENDIAVIPQGMPTQETELLSQRELVVLGLIAKGYSNNEIASILSLSLHTVKTHAKHINSKLKASNRTMAAARAKALGLLL